MYVFRVIGQMSGKENDAFCTLYSRTRSVLSGERKRAWYSHHKVGVLTDARSIYHVMMEENKRRRSRVLIRNVLINDTADWRQNTF